MRENGESAGFLDEVWLTPLQIARGFGYATDKPIRKAIMRGELKATHSPCRRKLLVAESRGTAMDQTARLRSSLD